MVRVGGWPFKCLAAVMAAWHVTLMDCGLLPSHANSPIPGLQYAEHTMCSAQPGGMLLHRVCPASAPGCQCTRQAVHVRGMQPTAIVQEHCPLATHCLLSWCTVAGLVSARCKHQTDAGGLNAISSYAKVEPNHALSMCSLKAVSDAAEATLALCCDTEQQGSG